MTVRLRWLLGLAACLAVGHPTRADVTLPVLFSDHMVLQRDVPAPVWGTATPGERVTVTFAGQTRTTTADKAGAWMVVLDPLKASDRPAELVVAGANTITIQDVLVGEVWLGSGQSNMAMSFGDGANGQRLLDLAKPLAKNRLLRVSTCSPFGARPGPWRVASPEAVQDFSMQLFFFGAALQKELGVPVGLITRAVCGSSSVTWADSKAFHADPRVQALLKAAGVEAGGAPPTTKKGIVVGECYQRCIAPVIPYAMRGVAWDQGEAGSGVTGLDQFTSMSVVIGSWRRAWNEAVGPARSEGQRAGGDFWFILNQKPSGFGPSWYPARKDGDGRLIPPPKVQSLPPISDAALANPREHEAENYVRIARLPNVGMSMTYGLGSGMHPGKKELFGARLARTALGLAYGRKEVTVYGPTYESMRVEGDQVRIQFRHTGSGLMVGGEKLQGFSIAGPDGKFRWAEARIDGDTVVVSSPQVPRPAHVRYLYWTSAGNLFNKEGEPAVIFRTDAGK